MISPPEGSARADSEAGIDVWAIELDRRPCLPLDELDAHELARARRLRAGLRQRFLVAHAATRAILGAYAGSRPGALEIGHAACPSCGAAHGRPFLAGDAELDFNLTRSEGLALLAVARRRIGIDLEWAGRPIDVEPLAAESMAVTELEAFRRLPAERRRAAFFASWTRKESIVKADGVGLTAPLSAVPIDPDLRGGRLLYSGERWYATVAVELPDPAYVAALATQPPMPPVRLLRWRDHAGAAQISPR